MFKNSTDAFGKCLQFILSEGQRIVVRDHEVKEVLSQFISISNPVERVLITPYRANNIFATIAETIWVISGRNDLEFLVHYLPNAKDFSDDGKVWRAGYGSRLRHWGGLVDQVQEVLTVLSKDKASRRAVMVIFNPSEDYVESRDVPCNNWLHFIIRNNKLYLNVAIRSNDIIWGFSGINTFEWSVLQEMLANWLGTDIGSSHYLIGSLHLYERHYERAQRIVRNWRKKSLYDFGFSSFKFQTPFIKMEKTLSYWFEIESQIRSSSLDLKKEIQSIDDNFLKYSLYMLYIYNQYLNGKNREQIFQLILDLPISDFRIAAIEYFSREGQNIDFTDLSIFTDQEIKYLKYFRDVDNNQGEIKLDDENHTF